MSSEVPERFKPKPRAQRQEWKPFFLAMLILEGTIASAAREAGVSYRTVMAQRQKDKDFAAAMLDAVELHTQRLEKEAIRRAVDGVEKAVYFRGVVVGKERQYSDGLLQFLLRARRPDVYRENNTNVSVSATAAAAGQINNETLYVIPDSDRRQEVAAILQEALGTAQRNDVTHLPQQPELPPPPAE